MKGKLAIGLLLMTILMAVGAFALTTTINPPTTGSYVNGNVQVNITATAADASIANLTNCTVTLTSSTTANTSLTYNNLVVNRTTSINWTNGTLITSNRLEDGTYTMAAYCQYQNGSVGNYSTPTSITIIVDNDIPDTPVFTAPTSGVINQSSATIYLVTTINSSETSADSCTLKFIGPTPGLAQYTMTEGTNQCSKTFENVPDGTYEVSVTVTDGTNSTVATRSFSVDTGKAGKKQGVKLVQQSQQAKQGISPLLIIGGLLVVGYLLTKKKKR